MKAKDIMTTDVVKVVDSAPIRTVAKTLLKFGISGAPVVDAGDNLVGIISEGDLVRRVETGTEHRRSWWLEMLTDTGVQAREYVKEHARRVGDVMTRNVVTARTDSSLDEISTLLETNHIKRVPIVDGGKIVGIVSRANLLRAIATHGVSTPNASGDDSKIRKAVFDRLKAQPWYLSPINVIVSGGKVGLWGAVGSGAEKTAARVAAETTPGVAAVDDHLIVRSDSFPYH